ncbi:hypothetical protein TRIUR3_30888 [Triticum urartu]|uniref:Uncharacterized protein n=1 Tax=Triticum urartu TaxID=4572 RepID=M7Z5E7_TRIUA|nr:hypothetical protein TRIUR3_30888 [Triticum urartu]
MPQPIGAGAVAAVLRDSKGNFLAAQCKYFPHAYDAVTSEAMAMREGLIFANSLGFPRVKAESDSLVVIQYCTGSFICGLVRDRANRHSDLHSSDNSIQLDQREEEGEEMESLNQASRKLVQAEIPCSTGRLLRGGHASQASLTEEITVAQATESSSEVSANNRDVQETSAGTEEVESLKRVVSALEERAAGIEARTGPPASSRGSVRKVTKQSKQEFDAVDGRILALDAREAEMATRCQGFEQLMEEMKQLVLQIQKEKGTSSENAEDVVERSMQSGKGLLEVLRGRWAADMEELIYLGWITAWLQHDLLASDGEGGTANGTAVTGDHDGETIPTAEGQREKGMKMVAATAPSNEVKLCKTSSCGAAEESCMGLAGCRIGIGRPRLLRKLRGWARGNGPSKSRRPCAIEGPSSESQIF